ncbi:MAG: TetR family transcriptional regulator [Pseudolabrys sp.]|jgi:TetR/AcrR family transcriptional repressor of nem operon
MRVTREQAAENKARVIKMAARLFRERGYHGVGLADIMSAADLTHGGFYGQFESKEDLAAQACHAANAKSAQVWRGIADAIAADKVSGDLLEALVDQYLSRKHRDSPATGCAFATVAVDAARQGGEMRAAFTDGLLPLIEVLEKAVPGRTKAQRRRTALAKMSELVGAVILARAVHDEKLSDAILSSARQDILALSRQNAG